TGASWPAAGALPVATVSYSTSGYTVTITPHLTVTALTTTSNTPSGCTSLCSGTAKVDSPIKGDIDYTVTRGGGQVMADFTISGALGTTRADPPSRAAPSAGGGDQAPPGRARRHARRALGLRAHARDRDHDRVPPADLDDPGAPKGRRDLAEHRPGPP